MSSSKKQDRVYAANYEGAIDFVRAVAICHLVAGSCRITWKDSTQTLVKVPMSDKLIARIREEFADAEPS